MPLTITESDMQMIEDTLERFGAQHYESGRVMNRGDALIAICKIARELPAAERRKRIKVAS